MVKLNVALYCRAGKIINPDESWKNVFSENVLDVKMFRQVASKHDEVS